jgi:hypothetical protein
MAGEGRFPLFGIMLWRQFMRAETRLICPGLLAPLRGQTVEPTDRPILVATQTSTAQSEPVCVRPIFFPAIASRALHIICSPSARGQRDMPEPVIHMRREMD